jgi:hypothetical protein
MNNLPIKVMESKKDGLQALQLTEGAFEGIIYTYGKVEFDEDEANDTVNLKFEYEILDYADKGLTDKVPFEQYIGKILEELIHQGIANNDLTYTGGVDENRTKDSEQSDT